MAADIGGTSGASRVYTTQFGYLALQDAITIALVAEENESLFPAALLFCASLVFLGQ
jgi:hypothetical protein